MNTESNRLDSMLDVAFPDGMAEKLHGFFENIWLDHSEYKVIMARRAFNLNYIFIGKYRAVFDQEYLLDNIISNNALLLSAKRLAIHYAKWGFFPKILICDDIMMYGRTIMRLIDELYSGIVYYIRQLDIKEHYVLRKNDLFDAITIYVFTKNDESILVDNRYRLITEEEMPITDIRHLSQQISDCIQNFGMANTSYVISSDLSNKEMHMVYFSYDRLDTVYSFQYRGRNQIVYVRERRNSIGTIRVQVPDDYSDYGNIITSLVILDSYNKDQLDAIGFRMADWFRRYVRNGRIAEILECRCPFSDCTRMQMISYILSVFNLAYYGRRVLDLNNNELYQLLIRSDYGKIAANFDFAYRIADELADLFQEVSFNRLTDRYIIELMSKGNKEIIQYPTHILHSRKGIYELAENIFYEKGIDAEEEAFSYKIRREIYDTQSEPVDSIDLNGYLYSMEKYGKSNKGRDVGCALCLMDSGLISMNIEKREYSCYPVLKAGELATSVFARRYSVFIPALAVVEKYFYRRGKYKMRVLDSFIDFLQGHCYSRYSEVLNDDKELLKEFVQDKDMAFEIYRTGQIFGDWNTDIVTDGDRVRTNTGRSQWHMSKSEEDKRKEYYTKCAFVFLNTE